MCAATKSSLSGYVSQSSSIRGDISQSSAIKGSVSPKRNMSGAVSGRASMRGNVSAGNTIGMVFTTDDTLTLDKGVLSVNTTNQMEQDNTLPITSAGVFATVGNIEVLLKTI